MSEQATLQFNPVSPVAANADPETSHQAARRVTRDGTRRRQAEDVLAALKAWQHHWIDNSGCTTAELAVLAHLDRHLVARRMPELADPANGALVERGEARECRVTGRMAITWRVREGG